MFIMKSKILKKANICLECINKPCQKGCPLENNIPGFISCIKEKKYQEAYNVLTNTTIIPSICGKICPFENQCQGFCVRNLSGEPVRIGELEAFIGKIALEQGFKIKVPKKTHHHVLVIGGGPSGLTCAAFLRKSGIRVTIMERYHFLGGLLMYGIPNFRLSKKLVKRAIHEIIDLGIEVIYNQSLGYDFSLKDVINKYDAIYIGIGANVANKLQIKGSDLSGVYGANQFLEAKIKLNLENKTVVIVGCGNVAMDVSRTIKRQGAKHVIVIYRKRMDEMTANIREYEAAKQDGVEFLFETDIACILGKDHVQKLELIKLKNNHRHYKMRCHFVISAIGSKADGDILKKLHLKLDEFGRIKTYNGSQTSNSKVFAGGDITNNYKTVAWACRSGRNAAVDIINYLKKRTI